MAAALFFGAIQSRAYDPDYSPFAPGTEPTNTVVCAWSAVTNSAGRIVSFVPPPRKCPGASLILEDNEDGLTTDLTIRGMGKCKKFTGLYVLHRWEEVFSGDLNHDGREDFILQPGWGIGVGIAGWNYYLTLLLSDSKGGYAEVSVLNYFSDPVRDFVDVDGDGRCEFIQLSLIYGGHRTGERDRYHNYRLFHLLRFEGTTVVAADDRDPRFPAWIWWTFKPNHRDDPLLPAAERIRLWKEQGYQQYAEMWPCALPHGDMKPLPAPRAKAPGKKPDPSMSRRSSVIRR